MIGMYLIVIGITKSLDTSFDIPTERSVVIKNGIDNFPIRKIYKKGNPIKLNTSLHTLERFKCIVTCNARNRKP